MRTLRMHAVGDLRGVASARSRHAGHSARRKHRLRENFSHVGLDDLRTVCHLPDRGPGQGPDRQGVEMIIDSAPTLAPAGL